MDKYYKSLQEIYTNNGGWNAYYYGVFSKIINDNNYKTVAEVGIGYGFHAEEILKNTKVDKLYLIDPMKKYQNDSFSNDVVENGGFDALAIKIKELLYTYSNKYTWFRKPSIEILNEEIEDNLLDAVFLDGDHSYDAVSQDLPFWWKKIKNGGQLLGDDYFWDSVKIAVDEFVIKNNLKLKFLYKENGIHPDYKIYQIVKV